MSVNIDDYVCVRSRDQGVMYGYLEWHHDRSCSLREPRQQFNWSKNAMTLLDVIVKGPKATNCRLSQTLPGSITMTEICGIYQVPENRIEEFRNYPADPVNNSQPRGQS